MDTLSALLQLDKNALKLPEKTVRITRLSEKTGQDVQFTLQGLSAEKLASAKRQSQSFNAEKGHMVIDNDYMRKVCIYESVSKPQLSDAKLQAQFNADGDEFYDIVDVLFTRAEQLALEDIIGEISGLIAPNAIEEIKKK